MSTKQTEAGGSGAGRAMSSRAFVPVRSTSLKSMVEQELKLATPTGAWAQGEYALLCHQNGLEPDAGMLQKLRIATSLENAETQVNHWFQEQRLPATKTG